MASWLDRLRDRVRGLRRWWRVSRCRHRYTAMIKEAPKVVVKSVLVSDLMENSIGGHRFGVSGGNVISGTGLLTPSTMRRDMTRACLGMMTLDGGEAVALYCEKCHHTVYAEVTEVA